MIKFPGIRYYQDLSDMSLQHILAQELVITEKLDGLNTMLHGGKVYDKSGNESRGDYHALVKRHHAWRMRQAWFVWGEDLYARHSCEYDPIHEVRTFRPFAAMRHSDGLIASWDDTETLCKEYFWKVTPVISRLTPSKSANTEGVASSNKYKVIRQFLEEIIAIYSDGDSILGGEKEGIVVRPTRKMHPHEFAQLAFKVVRPGHVQPDAEHWRKNWKPRDIIWANNKEETE